MSTIARNKRNFIIGGLFVLGFVFVVFPLPTSAATCTVGKILPPCTCTGDCHFCDFVLMFVNLGTWFLGLAALFALYFLVNGAFSMVVSSGNPQRLEAGKKTLTGALVGLFMVFAAWAIINTLFAAFVGKNNENVSSQWWKLGGNKCPTTEATIPTEEQGPPPSGGGQCNDFHALADKNNVPYPCINGSGSAALNNLISCVRQNVPAGWIDTNQIYTCDQDHPACNYIRGRQGVCGVCSHSEYSCHYGGHSGTNGPEGVDFNAAGGHTEDELYDKIAEALNGPCHGMAGFHQKEPSSSPTHTHVSTTECDGN